MSSLLGSVTPTYSYTMAFLRIRICKVRLSTLLLFLILSALFIFLINHANTSNAKFKSKYLEDDILNPNYLQRQAYRRKIASKFHFDDDNGPVQLCKVPKLSLKTDVNTFAFHEMEPLKCAPENLLYLKDYVVHLKKDVLGKRQLKKCVYKAIEWESDKSYRFSEPLERKAPGPFEMKIKNEFFLVECFLNSTDDDQTSMEMKYKYEGGMRRLLQANNQPHQDKWRVASDRRIEEVVGEANVKNQLLKDIVKKVQGEGTYNGDNPGIVANPQRLQGQPIDQNVKNPGIGQGFQSGRYNTNFDKPRYVGSVGLPDSPLIDKHAQQVYNGQKESKIKDGTQQNNPFLMQDQQRQGQNQQFVPQVQQQQGQNPFVPQVQQQPGQNQQFVPQVGQQQGQNQQFVPQVGQKQGQNQQFVPEHQQQQGQNQQFVPQVQQQQGQNQQFVPEHQQQQGQNQQFVPQVQQQQVQNQQFVPQVQQQQGQNQQFVPEHQQQQGQHQQFVPHGQQQQGQNQQFVPHGQQQQGQHKQFVPQGQQQAGQNQQFVPQVQQQAGQNQQFVPQGQQGQTNQIAAPGNQGKQMPAKAAGSQKEGLDSVELFKGPADTQKKENGDTEKQDTKDLKEKKEDKATENVSNETNSDLYGPYGGDYNLDHMNFESADFEQFFAQIVPKEEVLKRVTEVKNDSSPEHMNVLIIAMDSMSHLTYQRKLPKTYDYIKKTLKSVVLNGYNIVGDATTAAIIPLTTGHTEMELPEVRKNTEGSTYVDAYPFIWNKFEQRGYVTLFTEDKPDIGTFNLRLNGFEEIPVDHYMRPFYQAVLESSLHQNSESYCTGGRPSHLDMLDYVKQYFERYPRNLPKFAFAFQSDLSHDDNNPAEYFDQDLMNLLEHLRLEKHLDNTLFILMGDHGARYSKVRKTTQGKLEERLPMMSLAFPAWFKKKYPQYIQNLEANAERLTTPFDIHATMLSILDLPSLKKPVKPGTRGLSLLREHPLNRTCTAAGVDMHWCTCMSWQEVDPTNWRVVMAAKKLVDHINGLIEKARSRCAKLALNQVVDAKLGLPNEKVLKYTRSIDGDQRVANFSQDITSDVFYLQLIVETTPSGAHFESTVTISDGGERYQVAPDISRINAYGRQPHCIIADHPDLRKFCYCLTPPPPERRRPNQRPRPPGGDGRRARHGAAPGHR